MLSIEDDGSGLPEDIDDKSEDSLGMTLVNTLTRQLKGESEFVNTGEGTTFVLTFEGLNTILIQKVFSERSFVVLV
ncbi:MAG: hypothetical protein U5J95_01305 [Balneolaceae bacterium]|nr:hypothetical protein [Balneolaceae bacterium]